MTDEQQQVSRIFILLSLLALAGCKRESVAQTKLQTYVQASCGGQPKWGPFGAESGELMAYNRLDVTPSAVFWNGVIIDYATLNRYLEVSSNMNPEPVTVLVPSPMTSCDRVESVRRAMETRLQCSVEKKCIEYSAKDWAKRHPPIN